VENDNNGVTSSEFYCFGVLPPVWVLFVVTPFFLSQSFLWFTLQVSMQLLAVVLFLLCLVKLELLFAIGFPTVIITSPILFFLEFKWRPVYVLNEYRLFPDILFTRFLTLDPLIFVIMADYYFCEPHYQLFEGYQPLGYLEEAVSLCVFEIFIF
jgi:hypothetical protein